MLRLAAYACRRRSKKYRFLYLSLWTIRSIFPLSFHHWDLPSRIHDLSTWHHVLPTCYPALVLCYCNLPVCHYELPVCCSALLSKHQGLFRRRYNLPMCIHVMKSYNCALLLLMNQFPQGHPGLHSWASFCFFSNSKPSITTATFILTHTWTSSTVGYVATNYNHIPWLGCFPKIHASQLSFTSW